MPIVLIAVVVIGLYLWSVYNKFVTTKTRIKASVQEIGNQLKRQADLIPNLVNAVKGYLKHEKAIFDELTEARKAIVEASSAADPQKMVDASSKFDRVFGQLRVVVENTPEIKAVEAITKMMDELRDTADKVMYARRTLIDLSADYNVMVVTFPSNLVAKLFKFLPEKGLVTPQSGSHVEVSSTDTQTPKVDL